MTECPVHSLARRLDSDVDEMSVISRDTRYSFTEKCASLSFPDRVIFYYLVYAKFFASGMSHL